MAQNISWKKKFKATEAQVRSGAASASPMVSSDVDESARVVADPVLNDRLEADLRYEMDDVFGPLIYFGMTALSAVPLDLGDHQTLHAGSGEGLAHLFQLVRPDRCDDQFHSGSLRGSQPSGAWNSRIVPAALSRINR